MKRVYFITPYNSLNDHVVEFVDHYKLFHDLDISQSLYLGLPLPSFSYVVLEEIDNHVCCWVRPQDHGKPVLGPHGPARMADLGLHMWSEVDHSENTLEL